MKNLLWSAVLLSLLAVFTFIFAVPGVAADSDNTVLSESEEDPIIGKWNLNFYSWVDENGRTMIIPSNIFKFSLGYDFMTLEIKSDGSALRTINTVDLENYNFDTVSIPGKWQKGEIGADIILENGDTYDSCLTEENTDYLDCMDPQGKKWMFKRAEEKSLDDYFVPKPNAVRASKESDFFGDWREMYMYSKDSSLYEREFGTGIMKAEFPIYVNISSGYLFWENRNTHQTITSDTYLRNGKLYTGLASDNDEIVFSLNDNGMISISYSDGSSYYFEKVNDLSKTAEGRPVLTVSSHEVGTDKYVQVEVSAPGADRIKLNGIYGDIEEKGEKLYFRYSTNSPETVTFSAEAFYNGKSVKSNKESVSFVEPSKQEKSAAESQETGLKKIKKSDESPSNALIVKCPDRVRAGETFKIEIQPLRNESSFMVFVYNSSWEEILEKQVEAGVYEFGPLPKGRNRIIINAITQYDHFMFVDVTAGDAPTEAQIIWKENHLNDGSENENKPINLGYVSSAEEKADSAPAQTVAAAAEPDLPVVEEAPVEVMTEAVPTSSETAEVLTESFPVSSETAEAEAPVAAPEKEITLCVDRNEIPVGSNVKVTVSAPGADAIKICRGDKNQVMKKKEGDHLEYQFTVAEAKALSLYAVASYGGVWSDIRSNEVTIKFY